MGPLSPSSQISPAVADTRSTDPLVVEFGQSAHGTAASRQRDATVAETHTFQLPLGVGGKINYTQFLERVKGKIQLKVLQIHQRHKQHNVHKTSSSRHGHQVAVQTGVLQHVHSLQRSPLILLIICVVINCLSTAGWYTPHGPERCNVANPGCKLTPSTHSAQGRSGGVGGGRLDVQVY